MLKAVIDTSVFISGLIKSPTCRKILKALEEERFILVVSPEIIAEIIGVISRPKFHNIIDKGTASRLIETIKSQGLLVRPTLKLAIIKDDPDDDKFLETAITVRANCIVSLDNHLLDLKTFRKIPVLLPSKFLSLLSKAE